MRKCLSLEKEGVLYLTPKIIELTEISLKAGFFVRTVCNFSGSLIFDVPESFEGPEWFTHVVSHRGNC